METKKIRCTIDLEVKVINAEYFIKCFTPVVKDFFDQHGKDVIIKEIHFENIKRKKKMFENKRSVEIPWDKITLEEAIYKMKMHDGIAYCDGDKKKVILIE